MGYYAAMNTTTTTAPVSANERLKSAHPTLDGGIARTLADSAAERFSDDDNQFLKFHGIYQEDDRDQRASGKKHYIFMVRLRLPGGVITPAQYLACDELAGRYANHTLRVTSRQSLQFHGVVKSGLGPLIKELNQALISTLAACGDVNRNVMAPPTPASNTFADQAREVAGRLALSLAPSTPAYHSIWVDGTALKLQDEPAPEFVDPLYGKTYLPRKFKIGFAVPPLNDVDILTHCCGFIAIAGPDGQLIGFNLSAGGGMGRSHNNDATFPRVADVIGFLPADRVEETARAVLTIHRDFGDRGNRKHARLKYVIADRGEAWFRQELQSRLGFQLEDPKPFHFDRQGDFFGWGPQSDGRIFLGLFVETGRIQDKPGHQMRTALRRVIAEFQPEVRFTPGNNALLTNLPASSRAAITAVFAAHGIDVERQGSALRRSSMACVSMPTCGLALAEAERRLPALITDIEGLLEETGLAGEEIVVRMTGCPNGCARPYMAEIGLVGKAPGRYQVWLGGNQASVRLNRLYLESARDEELVPLLRQLLGRFAAERAAGERFGDWCARVLWNEPAPAKA